MSVMGFLVTTESQDLGLTSHPKDALLCVSKPALTVKPQSSVFTGDSVTLRCEVIQSQNGWEFLWRKDSNPESTGAATKTIKPVTVSDGGEYSCRARRGGYYTDYSKPAAVTIYGKPKPKVTIKPLHVFREETVTLRCDIYAEGVTSWSYRWYKEGLSRVFSELQEHTFSSVTESDAGKYSCKGSETEGSRWSQMSDKVTLTVSDPKAVLSVSPQKWLTEGDPVTLICEVHSFSTGWTFSWFTLTDSADQYNLLSDSSRGAGGNYTVSSAVNHTGVYVCRAEREKSVYKTQHSNTQQLWVTGVSPPVSLIVSPSRTQHFTSVSLSLSCEDQSNSTGWRVRRYTDSGRLEDCSSLRRGSQTGSTCTIRPTNASHTGVYWCQSESGEKHHPVNITVHSGVILESPVHPVTEGDHLTLRCLYRHTTAPNLRADFYKDGSLIQNQTTEMSITTVSKSHEGFYSCKHPERGASPKSWISVRAPTDSRSDGLKPMIIGVTAGLTLTVFIIVLLLLWRYRNNKGGRSQSPSSVSQQQISSQTSDQNQSEAGYNTLLSAACSRLHFRRGASQTSLLCDEGTANQCCQGGRSQSPSSVSQQQISSQTSHQNQSEAGYNTLLSGTAQFYDTVYATVNDDSVSESSEHMYAEIELKSTTKQKKNKENETESSDCLYSKLALQTDQGAGSSEATYVQVK
ncbi:Fc receptor-like protein 5 isoform X1 [Onychostoma macrolepis]|uniref:Fc receptor-like protein 5 isoform X1 n=1 Tax=Onychostoma macrolepis TaxID=369639 RepID=UPI00272A9062|nr:Fc receptor-like protein 5 isoform X1 [Onychostoma macrolepis]